MKRKELEERTKKFHIKVLNLCQTLPKNTSGFETARQIIRSSGSIAANYRASRRAKSRPDFIYKIEIVLEEADETLFWLEVIKEAGLSQDCELNKLLAEANELTAIFAATDKTAKANWL